ncbi:hypothetical protein [Haloflavibacter putidus]|uniref:N-acetyltransferase domain-containing protein n=1 Tax=Haloflavibacter putidus TaxID=2576776 RepID=A0A507ZSE6_9FLAO|nr:hypothetical protein [Haloflavibacter putidus]TQD37755.1 hypothetical protein FKR84_09790 [Haloflavibacter putidus]
MNKEVIIDRVAEILKETPTSMEIVKKGKNRDARFHYLAKYMVDKAIEKDALILSENQMGISIVIRNSRDKANFLKDTWEDLKLVWNVTGFKNIPKILKNQQYVKNQRPKDQDYLYCWFWGISKDNRGAGTQVAKEMKDEFLRLAHKYDIPLFAETQMRRNTIVYQKFGFDLFHTWNRDDGKTMYFLKYDPKKHPEKNAN